MYSGNWKAPQREGLGWLGSISDSILRYDLSARHPMPYLGSSESLVIASDYAGSHDTPFRVYAFLAAGSADLGPWQKAVAQLRRELLPQSRRLSFKRLRDLHRARALMPFLDAAGQIPGFLLVVAVSRRMQSLLDATAPADSIDDTVFAPVRHWKRKTMEELYRVTALVSLVIAGLSRPGHDVLWVSDEDAIFANEDRMREVSTVLSGMASNLLDHDLRHLRWTTTHYDPGDCSFEDLVAVPDLAAGAMLDVLQRAPLDGNMVPLDERSSPILWWLTQMMRMPSRFLLVDKIEQPGRCGMSTIGFSTTLRAPE